MPDRQRERHGGHRRDPVRRQRPAGRAGRPPGPGRRAGPALRRRRPLRQRPAQARRAPRSPRCAARPTWTAVRIGGSGAAASAPAAWPPRSRRPGSPPAPASRRGGQRRRAPPGRWPGRRSAPTSPPPAGAPAPGCCGWPTPPSRTAGSTWTQGAVDAVTEPPRLAAARRHHQGRRAPSRPVTRSTCVAPDGTRGRPRPGQLRRGRDPHADGPLHPRLARERGREYEREVVHRDDMVLLKR